MNVKGLSRNLLIRIIVLAVVVIAFLAYGICMASAEASKAENIKNAANSSTRGAYLKDGTFSGSAQGYGGITDVEVTITNGYITNVEVTHTYDDSPYIENASAKFIPDMINNQTTTVDVVTNASYSSNGIRFAVRDALRKADAMPDSEESDIANSTASATEQTDTLSIGYLMSQQEKKKTASNTSGVAGGL